MVIVEVEDTYRQERTYVLKFVLRQVLGLDYRIIYREDRDSPYVSIILPNKSRIVIKDILFQTPAKDWLSTSSIPPSPTPTTVIIDDTLCAELTDPVIPLLFAGEAVFNNGRPIERKAAEYFIVHFDLLGAVFFMITRYEELAAPMYDSHHRFDSSHSIAVKNGFEMRPLVDEYIALLRSMIFQLDPSVQCNFNHYDLELSYDLDRPYRFKTLPLFIKNILKHVLKQGDHYLAIEYLKEGFRRTRGLERDSFFRGMLSLLNIAEKYGVRGQINVMGSLGGMHDDGYHPGSHQLKKMLKSAESNGHRIGFHPGYVTYNDAVRFSYEKVRLEEELGIKISRMRQHYLRMHVPSTWRIWEENQITNDSSLGFPDRNGFRAGTAHKFMLFDLEKRCELSVRETPLIVMDGALKARFNEDLAPDQAIDKAVQLAKVCKKYGGTFSLLWHNSSLHGDWSGWGRVYEEIVKHAAELIDE